jgi:hypothetical protein
MFPASAARLTPKEKPMRSMWKARLLAVAVLLAAGGVASADFIINVPFVGVRVGGGGVEVRAPFVHIVKAPRAAMAAPAPAELIPVEPPPGVPLEVAPPARPVPQPTERVDPAPSLRPPTVAEFARMFKPVPGNYEVVLLHPYSCKPVTVCFCLPEGCPRVEINGCLRTCLEFDYGKHEIEIWFYRDGRVKVER